MSLFGKSGRRLRGRDRNRATRPVIELCEDRTLLSIIVKNTNDSGPDSLRAAITAADATAGSTITFDIPTGPFVINLTSGPLPPVSAATTIDGTSQPGYSQAPIIVINGSSLSTGSGLDLTADGSTIEGLDIVGFTATGAAGIDVASKGNKIQSDYLGVAPGGMTAGPGNTLGILITGSNNTIGGTTAGTGNLIGFNTAAGVSISGTTATKNVLNGNSIGTDAAKDDLGNALGVSVAGPNNTIGGTATGDGNLIGDNTGAGVSVGAGGTGTSVLENFIGTDATGDDLGNLVGVSIGDSGNTIGQSGAGNTIGFNTLHGVSILSGNGNVVSQNLYEGTNGPGQPPPASDISLNAANNANNNQPAPVLLSTNLNTSTTPNTLAVNFTDTGPSVPAGTPIQLEIYLVNSTTGARQFLGTPAAQASGSTVTINVPNTVPLATGDIIVATATVTANGTSAFSGEVAISNPYVVTSNASSGFGSLYQVIQNAEAHPNPGSDGTTHITFAIMGSKVIGFNPADPLDITTPVTIDGTSQSGVQLNGAGQSSDGLVLGSGSQGSTIEGLDIVAFAGNAIRVESKGDTIADDRIGTDVTGTKSGPGNSVGILIDGVNGGQKATIGGTTAADADAIGFNYAAGVSISGAGATGNLIIGNFIGTDAAGDPLGNLVGVAVNGAGDNTIGEGGAGNTIGFNNRNGVAILSGNGNVVSQNLYEGTNGPGQPPPASDIFLDATNNANNSQPAPVLLSTNLITSTTPNTLAVNFTDTGPSVPAGTPIALEIYLVNATTGARQFLGAPAAQASGSTVTINVPNTVTLVTGDIIVATATVTANGTSAFSAEFPIANPYTVTNAGPNGPGSLFQVITYTDSNPNADPTDQTTHISFDVTGSTVINVSSNPLPVITVPVTLDGTTQTVKGLPIIQINGGGKANVGLTLGAGPHTTSQGSTIKGLDVAYFVDDGIAIDSNDDTIEGNLIGTDPSGVIAGPGNATGVLIDGTSGSTIGGTTSAAANTIGFNTSAGVSIGGTGGTGNAIRRNLYLGTNGPNSPVASNDITGATTQTAPILVGASYDSATGLLVLQAYENVSGTLPDQDLDIYLEEPGERLFEITAIVNLTGSTAEDPTAVSVTLAGLSSSDQLLATLIDPTNGTSTFSNTVSLLGPTVITTVSDSDVFGSLRAAIDFADSNPAAAGKTVSITFDIPEVQGLAAPHGPNSGTIYLFDIVLDPRLGPLPEITVPVSIDGSTESSSIGKPAVVQINGEKLTATDGLTLSSGTIPDTDVPTTSDGSTINSLEITNFSGGAGIRIESTGDAITDNLMGTDGQAADTSLGNQVGILIDGDNGGGEATIGGTTAAVANTIGFNSQAGVSISGLGANGNSIGFNDIGIDSTLKSNLGNPIGIADSSQYTPISGAPSQVNNTFFQNTIGYARVSNTNGGVGIDISAPYDLADDNVVVASDTGIDIGAPAGNVSITGNYLGANSSDLGDSSPSLGNLTGIDVSTSDNTIGGAIGSTMSGTVSGVPINADTLLGPGNVIAFSQVAGISISSAQNVVEGDFVGTDLAGDDLMKGTAGAGIILDATGETIGGTNTLTPLNSPGGPQSLTELEGNVIGHIGAGEAAISISGTSTTSKDSVLGNYLGVDPINPKISVGNGIGIAFGPNAEDNSIGDVSLWTDDGATSTGSNVIGFNSIGVQIDGYGATLNVIRANYIGTEPGGYNVGNAEGIELDGVSGNLIGGNLAEGVIPPPNSGPPTGVVDPSSISGNIIGFNSTAGVMLVGSSGNLVQGNYVGTDDSGSSLGNSIGIEINGSSSNTIGPATITGTVAQATITLGSTSAPAGNIISGNQQGILIENQAARNSIEGDIIGSAGNTLSGSISGIANGTGLSQGSSSLGNLTGIEFQSGADNNTIGSTIGGTIAGSAYIANPWTGAVSGLQPAANAIAGNLQDGIKFSSISDKGGGASDTISGNLIFQNGNNGIDEMSGWSLSIQYNLIGLDHSGQTTYDPATNKTLGNLLSGIQVDDSTAATITGNVISGNGLSGISVASEGGTSSQVSIQDNLIGTDVTGTYVTTPDGSLSLGNVLDGIQVDGVSGVTIGADAAQGSAAFAPVGLNLATTRGNLISGNRGRGIEIDSAATASTDTVIGANLIGVAFVDQQATGISPVDHNGKVSGNLSDGIFLLGASGNSIQGNVISANRGYGIHATGGGATTMALTISDDFIGTNEDGTQEVASGQFFGNGSDGIFFDQANGPTQAAPIFITGNIISGNRADGVDLLASRYVAVTGNEIGTNVNGQSLPGSATDDFGNASNGLFINQSSYDTIGGPVSDDAGASLGDSNIISGNHGSGVFVSGSAGPATSNNAEYNLIAGNDIGVSKTGPGQFAVVPNAVAGIILSNADYNMVGGASASSKNVISGNSLDGILLVNDAEYNAISFNDIGTDPNGVGAVPNSADGIFLLGGSPASGMIPGVQFNATGSSVTGNTIQLNVISGNGQDGIQIFGSGATSNTVVSDTIGLGALGATTLVGGGNKGNGVYLNNDGGGNVIGQVGSPNVISGNAQSGVVIFGTAGEGGGDLVQGNQIGTDAAGTAPVANGGNGVFVYGTSDNVINANTLSGNAQAGVSIFSPASSAPAELNVVSGNLIGGPGGIGNLSDGVDIYSGVDNIIGQLDSWNTISGNAGNGVLLANISGQAPEGNLIAGNDIGIDPAAPNASSTQQNGVLVEGGSGNQVGVAMGSNLSDTNVPSSPSNVISGNRAAGVQFAGTASNNFVRGNYIGVNGSGVYTGSTASTGNGLAGVFINNLGTSPSDEAIGGTAPGAGNIIAGSSGGYGVNILGPVGDATQAANSVQGNLIGIDRDGNPAGNSVGVYIQNSWGNQIGGPGGAGNVISANAQAGVELTGLYATRNTIQGNEIGTDATGTMRPGNVGPLTAVAPSSLQTYGVYIATPSPSFNASNAQPNNMVVDNVISGNLIGVDITGVGSGTGTGQGVPFGLDVISGNFIGTGPGGNSPNPNFEYGVYINNSAGDTVGGTTSSSRNILSANGIDGVEIFGGTTQAAGATSKTDAAASRNVVIGNTIGDNSSNQPRFRTGGGQIQVPDGPTITLGEQLYGVVVIGSSSNIIGSKAVGNTIGGNVEAGVYITRDDFKGNVYSVATGNTLNSNTIAGNGIYGVYRFESPNNPVAMRPQRHPNKFHGNVINLEDYIKSLNGNTQLPRPHSRFHSKKASKGAKAHHARHPKTHGAAHHHARLPHPVRPRFPALFRDGVISKRVEHAAVRVGPPAGGRPAGAETPPGTTTSSTPSLIEREVSVSLAAARSGRDDAHHRPERPH